MQSVEIYKLFDGPNHIPTGHMNEDLDDFIAIAAAGVAHIEAERSLAARLERAITEPQVLILKRGVA